MHFSRGEEIIETEISKLLTKNVIAEATHCEVEFISTVFTRPKNDGLHRLILNLKRLNEHVTYKHFTMKSLQTAAQLIKQGSWMAVLDLKDAYYSVPIVIDHRKYLNLYEFTCLPNGLSSAPRSFAKLMIPVYASLRSRGFHLVGYIDDILLLADTPQELDKQVSNTIKLLKSLDFTVHDTMISDKSITTSQISGIHCKLRYNGYHHGP